MSTVDSEPALAPWAVEAADYPRGGPAAAQLAFLVRYAVLAPSDHNTQPWTFRVAGDVLEVRTDRSRGLPVTDPEGRGLVISCGAAIGTLRIAARRFGHDPEVALLPAPADRDLLARVRLGPRVEPGREALRATDIIRARHTSRLGFEPRRLPAALLADLGTIVPDERVWLALVTEPAGKRVVADLAGEANRLLMADRAYRRELSHWLRPNHGAVTDGLRGEALGLGNVASRLGPLVVRTFDLGAGQATQERRLALDAPALAVLGSRTDTTRDWLATGEALQRLLLRLADAGASAAFANQPIQVPALRAALAQEFGRLGTDATGAPQLLLRLGYAKSPTPPSPRRPLAEVLTVTA
jgi:nitroreductase